MGRYVYNSNLVTQTIDELNDAIKAISDVAAEIQSGLNIINNATGSQYIEIKSESRSALIGLQAKAEEIVESDISTIRSKVTAIEEYENAPFYKKLFASVGMGVTKFAEGVVSGFEDLGDGVVSIVGFIGGIFNSEFADSVAEYVGKDHVGDWFAERYKSGALSSLEKYSWYSSESTAANIFKGIGCAAPYIALSMTGVGVGVEVGAAVVSGIGSGTEAGIQKALAEDTTGALSAGDVFSKSFAKGVLQGAVSGALVYGMNNLTKTIQTRASTPRLAATADDFTSASADDILTKSEKIFTKTGKFKTTGLGKLIDKIDDGISGVSKKVTAKVTEKISGTPRETAITKIKDAAGSVVTTIKGNKLVNGVAKVTSNFIANNPGTAYALAGTMFTATKVANEKTASNYRKTTGTTPAEEINIEATTFNSGAQINPPTDTNNNNSSNSNSNNGNNNSNNNSNNNGNSNSGNNSSEGIYFDGGQNSEENTNSDNNSNIVPEDDQNNQEQNNSSESDNLNKEENIQQEDTDKEESVDSEDSNKEENVQPEDTDKEENIQQEDTDKEESVEPEDTNKEETTQPEDIEQIIPPKEEINPGVVTPPSNNENNNVNSNWSGGSNYMPYPNGSQYNETIVTPEPPQENPQETIENTMKGSLEEVIGNNEIIEIPSSSDPITIPATTTSKKSVIPTIAGLGAAALAGIGTKTYLDKKENKEEDLNSEEWSEETDLEIDYNDNAEEEKYLTPSDEYAYQEEDIDYSESYEAIKHDEITDM